MALLLCSISQAAVVKPAPKREPPKPLIQKPALPKPTLKPIQTTPEVQGQLVLSPSAETGPQLYTSWPLILSTNLWRKAATPDDKGNVPVPEPITIKAKEGSWREALVIDIRDASGTAVQWPLHPVKQDDPSVTLGVDDSASAEWWLEPSETQNLPAGRYMIIVSFNPKLVDGLLDRVVSDRYRLNIVQEPSPLDKDTETAKQLRIAMLSMFKGDSKTANDQVDKVLALDPESIGGHRLKSRILLGEGKRSEAISSLNDALDSYYKKYPDACPPAGLIQQRDDMMKDVTHRTLESTGSER